MYLNQYYKESVERKSKEMKEWKKNPTPSSEACSKAFEMHRKLKEMENKKAL